MFALTQEEAGEWQRRVQGENKKEKYFFLFLQKITTSIDSPSDFQVVALSWGSVAPPKPPGQCQPGFVATLVLKVYKSKQSWAKFFLQLCSRSVFATFYFFSQGFLASGSYDCHSALPHCLPQSEQVLKDFLSEISLILSLLIGIMYCHFCHHFQWYSLWNNYSVSNAGKPSRYLDEKRYQAYNNAIEKF